jgi:hypothetical protein
MAHPAKDAAFKFVHYVEVGLFKLYQEMRGHGVVYVAEREFDREIRTCVTCFYWERNRNDWVVNKELQRDDAKALEIIKKVVCVHLAAAAAAEMEEDRRRYSAAIQTEFERIWRYVREWLGEDEATAHGGESTGDLLAALKELVRQYDK